MENRSSTSPLRRPSFLYLWPPPAVSGSPSISFPLWVPRLSNFLFLICFLLGFFLHVRELKKLLFFDFRVIIFAECCNLVWLFLFISDKTISPNAKFWEIISQNDICGCLYLITVTVFQHSSWTNHNDDEALKITRTSAFSVVVDSFLILPVLIK